MDPITCGCCFLLFLILIGSGGGSRQTTNTIVIDSFGNQTITTHTQKSMGLGDLIGWIIIAVIFIPVIVGVLYVWSNSL